jgi:hypothetical protein
MTFQLSAGVNYSEIDLTGIVPAVGTTTGAVVGSFQWGPIDEGVYTYDFSTFSRS